MSSGVTDFIVAGPAGHVQAGPAGSFKAGEAGHVYVGPGGSVPISPAGHVPIDTSQARIPYAAPGGSPTEIKSGGALHTIEDGRGGIVNGAGGYVGGGGGGGFGGGGGGGTVGSGSSGSTGGGGKVDAATGSVPMTPSSGESHFIPGGQVPISSSQGGHFTPGGMVPVSTGGSVTPSSGGAGQATPGGHVPVTPGFSHFTPGGMVPIGSSGGGHFIPGGMVPIAPKLGIDPNIPPAHVNPPRAGHVQPSRLTNWHGPQDTHVQNWPRDQFNHIVSQKAWQPEAPKNVWEAPKGTGGFLTTDSVDAGALMQATSHAPMQDFMGPQVENKSFDFSQTFNVDRSIQPVQNNSMEVNYATNSEYSYQPSEHRSMELNTSTTVDNDQTTVVQLDASQDQTLDRHTEQTNVSQSVVQVDASTNSTATVDMRDQHPVQNDFSENDTRSTSLDLSTSVTVQNEFRSEHSTLLDFTEERNLTIDDSRSVHNDFSEFVDRQSFYETTVVNNTEINYQGNSVDIEFNQLRAADVSGAVERGAGSVLSAKS